MTTLPAVLSEEHLKNLVVRSNHNSPVSIEGVAEGRVRGTDIVAYFAVYKVVDRMDRVQISKELHAALASLLKTIQDNNAEVIMGWINQG